MASFYWPPEGSSGGVTNPLTANLNGGGFNITNVSQFQANNYFIAGVPSATHTGTYYEDGVINGSGNPTSLTGSLLKITTYGGATSGIVAGALTLQVAQSNSSSNAPDLNIKGGANTGTGAAGNLYIQTSNSASATQGGSIFVECGNNTGTGQCGNLILSAGTDGTNGNSNQGGNILISPGYNFYSPGASTGGVLQLASSGTNGVGHGTNHAALTIDAYENVILGNVNSLFGASNDTLLASTATQGFLYLHAMNGVPTGTPGETFTGSVPFVIDSADLALYIYSSGAWSKVSGGGGGSSPWTQGSGVISTTLAGQSVQVNDSTAATIVKWYTDLAADISIIGPGIYTSNTGFVNIGCVPGYGAPGTYSVSIGATTRCTNHTTSIGYRAGGNSDYSVFIGDTAGTEFNSPGVVCIGVEAGFTGSGPYASCIGPFSMVSTSSYFCTALGYGALVGSTMGNNTIAIGNGAAVNSGGMTVNGKGAIDVNGGFTPASMADSTANNNTIYYSTTASKLVYKDSTGTVNNLY